MPPCAASLRQHPGDATEDAQTTAAADLTAAGVPCLSLTTTVDTDDFDPGGTVTVTVRCEASMADVTLLGVPGRRIFTATAVEVIDTYHGVSREPARRAGQHHRLRRRRRHCARACRRHGLRRRAGHPRPQRHATTPSRQPGPAPSRSISTISARRTNHVSTRQPLKRRRRVPGAGRSRRAATVSDASVTVTVTAVQPMLILPGADRTIVVSETATAVDEAQP